MINRNTKVNFIYICKFCFPFTFGKKNQYNIIFEGVYSRHIIVSIIWEIQYLPTKFLFSELHTFVVI